MFHCYELSLSRGQHRERKLSAEHEECFYRNFWHNSIGFMRKLKPSTIPLLESFTFCKSKFWIPFIWLPYAPVIKFVCATTFRSQCLHWICTAKKRSQNEFKLALFLSLFHCLRKKNENTPQNVFNAAHLHFNEIQLYVFLAILRSCYMLKIARGVVVPWALLRISLFDVIVIDVYVEAAGKTRSFKVNHDSSEKAKARAFVFLDFHFPLENLSLCT